MDCKVTCFDRIMNLVTPLSKDKHKEAVEIIKKYNFQDFLDFCVENGCFTEMQSYTLYDGIVMWEDLDGNYWEEDYDKLHELYDRVGITEDVFEQFNDDKKAICYLIENYLYDCMQNGHSDFETWCEDEIDNDTQQQLFDKIKDCVNTIADVLFT